MSDALPHDREAEEAVLGAALLSETALFSIVDVVCVNDFYLQEHRLIFQAMCDMIRDGQPVDTVTLRAKLDQSGKLQEAGGVTKISGLGDTLPDVTNAAHYAGLVKDHSVRRGLLALSTKIQASAISADTAKDALDECMFGLTQLAESSSSGEIMHVADHGDKVLDDLRDVVSGKVSNVGVKTGLARLDNKVLMRNGRVIVLAGATSSGKSSLALQIADQVSTSGQTVAFFSLEMSGEELATRMLAARSGMDQRKIEGGQGVTQKQVDDLSQHLHTLRSGSKLYIDDNPGCTPLDIRARSRQIQMRYGLDLVVVDYLQLLTPAGGERGRSREQEVSAMSRSLKIAGRALGVPIILLSQLSRRHLDEKRKPELRDLRESGAIENDADVVMMIYRPDLEESSAELLVRKQRQGSLGSIQMTFNGESTSFTETNVGGVGQYFDAGAEEEEPYRGWSDEGHEDEVDF